MGAGTDGSGASAMGLTSAKRLSAVTGTGEAKVGLGRPKGLNPPPGPPFAPLPAGICHTRCCSEGSTSDRLDNGRVSNAHY